MLKSLRLCGVCKRSQGDLSRNTECMHCGLINLLEICQALSLWLLKIETAGIWILYDCVGMCFGEIFCRRLVFWGLRRGGWKSSPGIIILIVLSGSVTYSHISCWDLSVFCRQKQSYLRCVLFLLFADLRCFFFVVVVVVAVMIVTYIVNLLKCSAHWFVKFSLWSEWQPVQCSVTCSVWSVSVWRNTFPSTAKLPKAKVKVHALRAPHNAAVTCPRDRTLRCTPLRCSGTNWQRTRALALGARTPTAPCTLGLCGGAINESHPLALKVWSRLPSWLLYRKISEETSQFVLRMSFILTKRDEFVVHWIRRVQQVSSRSFSKEIWSNPARFPPSEEETVGKVCTCDHRTLQLWRVLVEETERRRRWSRFFFCICVVDR